MNLIDQPTPIDPDSLPHYGTKPTKPGLYLGLFHGREDRHERMDTWGFQGPAIGPLEFCHTTYALDIQLRLTDAADGLRYFGSEGCDFVLEVADDMIVFGGLYYGDWTVYYVGPDQCAPPADTFRAAKRCAYMSAHRRS